MTNFRNSYCEQDIPLSRPTNKCPLSMIYRMTVRLATYPKTHVRVTFFLERYYDIEEKEYRYARTYSTFIDDDSPKETFDSIVERVKSGNVEYIMTPGQSGDHPDSRIFMTIPSKSMILVAKPICLPQYEKAQSILARGISESNFPFCRHSSSDLVNFMEVRYDGKGDIAFSVATSTKHLVIYNSEKASPDMDHLKQMGFGKDLTICSAKSVDMKEIESLHSLETLVIKGFGEHNTRNVYYVSECKYLRSFCLWDSNESDIDFLSEVGSLKTLTINNCPRLRNISAAYGLSKLFRVSIIGMNRIDADAVAPFDGNIAVEYPSVL